ncbi:unnamed protein product [Aphanomyces euteiches]
MPSHSVDIQTDQSPLNLSYGTASSTTSVPRWSFPFLENGGDSTKLAKWLESSPEDVDRVDDEGKTALMRAVLLDRSDFVHKILQHNPNVDFVDRNGKTALMHAVVVGNSDIVSMLLEEFADLDVEDVDGNTATMLVSDALAHRQHGVNVSEWEQIKSLLKKENIYRSTSEDYRERFQEKVEQILRKQSDFNESLFRRAINRHPELGVLFLNECLVVDRHTLGFRHLSLIYGDQVRTSPLYGMLHPMNQEVQMRINKSVLSHPVMRRILELKWEMFGERIYYQQILAYILLLSTMTISAFLVGTNMSSGDGLSDGGDEVNVTDACLFIWCLVVSFVLSGLLVTRLLRPHWFWMLARFLYDGRLTGYKPEVVIPELRLYKRFVRLLIAAITLSATAAGTYFLYGVAFVWLEIDRSNPFFLFGVNNLFLWFNAIYFLRLELMELVGESGNFLRGLRPKRSRESKIFRRGAKSYFSSPVNWIQLIVYLVIILIYVPMSSTWFVCDLIPELDVSPPVVNFVLAIGSILTLTLWLLTLQFLEIHPTAGFLLPILPSMLMDMWNFCIFYAAIDWGFTACFYIYMHGANQDFEKFGSVFSNVFYVMFGQKLDLTTFQDQSVNNVTDKTGGMVYEMYGSALTMIHSGVVVVFMLNLLLAMMNKSMNDGLENAKTEALASYARCLMRMELSTESKITSKLIYVNQRDPLTHEYISYLNPAFAETKNKSEYVTTSADQAILRSFDESSKTWHGGLKAMKAATLARWQELRQSIPDLEAIPTLKKTLDSRENAMRKLFATANAATLPTKLNVETRLDELSCEIAVEVDAVIAIAPPAVADLVRDAKTDIRAAFDEQIENTREAMTEPEDLSFGAMWKSTQSQWKRQEQKIDALQRQIQTLLQQRSTGEASS